jgi:hypothetical protein
MTKGTGIGGPNQGMSGGYGHNRKNSDFVNVFDQSRNSIANIEDTISLDRNGSGNKMNYD